MSQSAGLIANTDLAMPVGLRYTAAMKTKRTNPDYLNGVPELLLLHLLSRRPMYGYELVQAIRQSTDGALEFGEGCVYPILHRLEIDGLLCSRRETVAGRSRVVYRITPQGSRRLTQATAGWRQIVGAVERVLHGGELGQPAMV